MISIITSIVSIIVTAVSGYIVWYLQQHVNKKDNTSKALMLLLRHELKEYYQMYSERGSITMTELEEYIEIYETYHSLGGNGLATKLLEEVKKIDVKGD